MKLRMRFLRPREYPNDLHQRRITPLSAYARIALEDREAFCYRSREVARTILLYCTGHNIARIKQHELVA